LNGKPFGSAPNRKLCFPDRSYLRSWIDGQRKPAPTERLHPAAVVTRILHQIKTCICWIWQQEGELHFHITPQESDLTIRLSSGEATVCLQEWHDVRSGKVTSSRQTVSSSNAGIASSAIAHPNSAQPSALPNPLAALNASSGPLNFQSRPAFIPLSRRAVVRPTVKTSNSGGLPDLQKSTGQIPELRITATDPVSWCRTMEILTCQIDYEFLLVQFTVRAYEERTSATCLPLSFQDVAEGKLPLPTQDSQRKYDLAICSFALHLVGDASEMFSLLDELSRRVKWLVVLAPHKKPEVGYMICFQRQQQGLRD
jgi:hypothetical protein